MRRFILIVVLTLVHNAISLLLLFVVFGGSMGRFDTGGPTPFYERVADFVLVVLTLPLLPAIAQLPLAIRPQGFPGEHLVFLANGLIWAVCIILLWEWVRKLRARTRSSQGAESVS